MKNLKKLLFLVLAGLMTSVLLLSVGPLIAQVSIMLATAQAQSGSTLTNSFIYVSGLAYQNVDATGTIQPSNTLVCSDFPLESKMTMSKVWSQIEHADSGKFVGFAFYDSSGNRLTAATSTGASVTTVARVTYTVGGGALTLDPGTSGRLTVCEQSDSNSVFALVAEPAGIGYFMDPSAPIRYTAANAGSGGSTLTWPATLGAKTALTNGNYTGWMVVVP